MAIYLVLALSLQELTRDTEGLKDELCWVPLKECTNFFLCYSKLRRDPCVESKADAMHHLGFGHKLTVPRLHETHCRFLLYDLPQSIAVGLSCEWAAACAACEVVLL
jgi:hypothetical protein